MRHVVVSAEVETSVDFLPVVREEGRMRAHFETARPEVVGRTAAVRISQEELWQVRDLISMPGAEYSYEDSDAPVAGCHRDLLVEVL